jgi:hypothetical protein
MKKFYLLLLMSFYAFVVNGQGLKGIVCDDLNGYGLEKATVTLMRTSDSLLIGFQRTNMNGGYNFSKIKPDKYDIFISYPDYMGYATDVEILKNQVFELDTIRLIKNSQMLNEVTIIDGSKIKFKGDTIQFIADSFKVGSNANVEDLLKKLSGIQVNSKGEITAFGEKVEKVFVDGEEFFGSDPTIATRNIQAKAVDKVQVFDKTSKMEEMTGIPDDEKFKAINLTLKDEYKKGYFGKATAGIGLNPIYYDESLMLQAYTSKTKFSVYGIASNTGTTGLNFDDMSKYGGGGGMSTFYEGDGMMSVSYVLEDDDFSWDGRYNGQGLPKSISGGASFSTKLAKDKIKISGGYGYSDIKLNKESSDNSINYLQEKSYTQTGSEKLDSRVLTNSGKLKFEYEIDSFTNLTINASTSVKDNENFKNVHTRQVGLDSSLITTVDRALSNNKKTTSFNGDVALSRKFRKKGRFLGVNGKLNYSEGKGSSGLVSENNFYAQQIFQELDQLQTLDNTNLSYNSSVTYSEPINDKWSAQGNIYSRQTGNLSSRITNEFNDETQQYDRYIDTLSSDFNYVVSTNGGGLAFNYKSEKYNFRIGTNADYATTLRENKIDTTKTINKTFRWLPSANFNYKFNRTSSLRLRYSGSTRQPTIDQIQPVRDNSDPTVLIKGNPDLVQSYSQNMNISYNMWKALSDFSLWSYASFSNTFNDIVTNTYFDESRRSITTYTNVNGGFNSYVYVNFDMRFNKNFRGGIGLSGNGSKRVSYVNTVKTDVMNYSFSPGVNFNVEIEEKLDCDVSYYPSFNRSFGNLVAGAGDYFSQSISTSLKYKIAKAIELKTDLNWDYQGAENAFSQKFNQVLWNASVEWTIDKNKNFVCQLAINDILNQNTGYRRNVSVYSTQESRYNTIKRYGFISLIYNIKSKINNK